ncbi:AAA domain-containing protein, partial [Diaporthe sp. PMI_573]
RALAMADVIGVTTTGLAKNIAIVRRLRCKVVVCEEAAEVLEAHLISALMPGVEHFIQIGDHQQLRPQITNNALSMENPAGEPYQLDRSQFERLALGQPGLAPLPVAQLNVQRRMRPEDSRLIRETMYQRLEDHDSVKELPDVVGMRDNVFWLTHNRPEDAADEDTRLKSRGNAWEVGMVAALVRHLIRQGVYRSTDIAVLTPYGKQLQQLRSALSRDFEVFLGEKDADMLAMDGLADDDAADASDSRPDKSTLERKKLLDTIRLATVDNFQGEEAKVVVVSLVRSNDRRKVGFLRTPNRINVLLSRAQHGMYLIGNAETYCNVPMWVEVCRILKETGALGTALELQCLRHPETPIRCSEPEHFGRFSPDGGCSLPCDKRLEGCGHQCTTMCHSDTMHAAFVCIQPCPRIRTTCEHTCPRLCGDDCGPCLVAVRDVQLPCGHRVDILPCHQTLQRDKIRCSVKVAKTVARCGHTVSVACAIDVAAAAFKCPTPCTHALSCGHTCPGSCGGCTAGEDGVVGHRSCSQLCRRRRDAC